jgi:hypothetical protein
MTDREKVIKGLECCTTQGFGCIENKKCPYGIQRYGSHCVDSMLRDAIVLLKVQEPRVMTLEEVRKAYGSPMWFESKGTFRGEKGFWCLHLGVSPSFHIRLMPTIGEQSTELSLTAYGSVWRCWTSRPTDEQREATPWLGVKNSA